MTLPAANSRQGKRNGPLGWEHRPSAAGQGGKQQGRDPFSGEHIRLAAAGRHPGGRKRYGYALSLGKEGDSFSPV